MRPENLLSARLRSGAKPKVALYRETLQTTGFYMGRVVIVTREFASISSPPLRCRSLRETRNAPVCVFRGMAESIAPISSKPYLTWGRSTASRGSAPGPSKGRDGRSAPCSSSAMSSGRLFLDRVASQQSPSPLHRQPDHKILDESRKRTYHRTVTASFPPCLTKGVHLIICVYLCPSVSKSNFGNLRYHRLKWPISPGGTPWPASLPTS
jgi:hypothetical protein